MKTNDGRVSVKNEAATRYIPSVPTVAAIRGTAEAELERLKNVLLARELKRSTSLHQNVGLQRAANEAAALAWLTPYPLLFLPVLFEEKVRAARIKGARQALIRERSNELLALAE